MASKVGKTKQKKSIAGKHKPQTTGQMGKDIIPAKDKNPDDMEFLE